MYTPVAIETKVNWRDYSAPASFPA